MMSKPNREDNPAKNGFLIYEGLSPGAFGVCHLRVIFGEKKIVLLASELTHNPGPSIANSAGAIWYFIFARDLSQGVVPEWALLVEHYNDRAILGLAEGGDRYNIVHIGPENNVHRSHQSPEKIVKLAGISATDLEVDESILCVNPDDLEMELRRDSQLFH